MKKKNAREKRKREFLRLLKKDIQKDKHKINSVIGEQVFLPWYKLLNPSQKIELADFMREKIYDISRKLARANISEPIYPALVIQLVTWIDIEHDLESDIEHSLGEEMNG